MLKTHYDVLIKVKIHKLLGILDDILVDFYF